MNQSTWTNFFRECLGSTTQGTKKQYCLQLVKSCPSDAQNPLKKEKKVIKKKINYYDHQD